MHIVELKNSVSQHRRRSLPEWGSGWREYHAPMGSERDDATIRAPAADARGGRMPWPAAVRAVLWLDAVVLAALALALGGKLPALGHGLGIWTWTASAGSTLTAVLAALAAFELTAPGRGRAWGWLPVPGFALWVGASGLGCLALPGGTDVWGDTLAEAGECLAFLLKISAPLLALMLFMLWRAAPLMPWRAVAMGGIASAGAAASLLALVHPHDAALLDLGAHAIAAAVVLAVGAVAARLLQFRR